MRSATRALAAALTLAALSATRAEAQVIADGSPSARSGPYATLALGVGNTGLSCPSCDDLDRATGPAATVGVGYAFGPRFRLGLEFAGWSEDMGWAKKTLQSYSAVAQLYPSLSHGGWLRLGAGQAKLSVQETGAFEQSGPAFSLAGGWDFRLRGPVAIAPYALYLHQLPSDATGSGAREGKGRATMFQVGAAVTYRR